jgi:UDP-glucose 4-epimerase
MKILITGGFGYIGGRLAQHLSSQSGYDILLATRQGTEAPRWLPHAKVLKSKWESSDNLEDICKGIDVVIHLAGMNAQDSSANPINALECNAVATARLLQAAIRQGVKRFVYLSTAHVYSRPLEGVITEQTCPTNLHPYASSHRAGEDVVRAAHQREQIEGIVIRLSNAYGAPTHKNANCWMLLVNDLCRQAIINEELVLYSSGTQYRNFITIEDMVRAILHFVECPASKLGDGLFNLGAASPMRVIDLAELIAERCDITCGFKPPIKRPQETTQPKMSQPLDYRIDKLLGTGFILKSECNKEIDETLKFCHDHFQAKE